MTARAQRHARLPRGPLARAINVKSVPEHGLELAIVATSGECAAVSAELDLPAIASLSAHLGVTRRAGARFQVQGDLQAKITQRCVVTLDDFESRIEQSIDLMFAPVAEPSPHRPPRPAATIRLIRPIRSSMTRSTSARLSSSSWRWRAIPIRASPASSSARSSSATKAGRRCPRSRRWSD